MTKHPFIVLMAQRSPVLKISSDLADPLDEMVMARAASTEIQPEADFSNTLLLITNSDITLDP